MKRRDFLLDAARMAALSAVVPNDWRVTFRPRFANEPFSLGVASGDPTPNSAIIWTRLATNPLEPDGGMSGVRTGVTWQVADDEQFTKVVKNGRATAAPELGHSIHIDVTGLEPNRWYFYRFTSGDAMSPIGRLRTTPVAGAAAALKLGVVSCNHWEQGYYTAYGHLAKEEVDLVAHLGDYIYEYGPAPITPNRPRTHGTTEIRTLDHYRARYALYKGDPLFQAAHARCPWAVTWDDHEVDNNYAGLIGENNWESEEQMRARRAAAYQAWWEHQPVRVPRATSWADLKISRSLEWGATARLWMIDTRQYRANQACDDGIKAPCAEWNDPSRQFMGAADERWLEQGLAATKQGWQVIGNQTMVATIDSGAGAERSISMDSWSGYPAAQKRFVDMLAKHAANRSVVVTGDNHANWVNEIRTDKGATVAAEFLGTSISSGGDGSDRSNFFNDAVAAKNPHVRWQNNRRGYFVCDVTGDTWRTEFKTVPFVSRPDAPIATASKWRLTRGRPGVERE